MTVQTDKPVAHHLGYAVYDAEATARRYERTLGAEFRLMPPYHVADQFGRPAELKVYYGSMAGLALEIIEVVKGNTPHSDWLKIHGEGIQHIGVYVPDLVAAARKAVADGGRVDWVYPPLGTAQISASSTIEEVLAEVNPNGLVYIDVKHGGTVLELLGPPIHNMVMGTVLKGMEELINTPLPPVV